ncbi:MAG TPA: hypothetical protein VD761_09395 [Solirubrobacterales bacterium]|jgi:hypothetical protein|nr:hypothetical protein [Solirubrobacterales bacterium]
MAAVLVPATAATAAPTGEYARFANCPYTNPATNLCIYAETVSGLVKTGNKTVPIKNKVILQGGAHYVIPEEPAGPLEFIGATNGETLSKSPQPVPGGLTGITAPSWWPSFLRNLFNETINNGFTGVTATMELAGPPSAIKLNLTNTLAAQGTALGMPVKIKLSNTFLGNNCYIGSNSNPIQLNLTTGTTAPPPPNQPISGSPGHPEGKDGGTLLIVKENKLVNNSFSVPGANGCGGLFSFLIDPFVDSIVGIPSPAGNNAAILEGTTYLGDPAVVSQP